ncbi:MAG: hypothetical protein DI498_04975 [Paracoccus denitrificans]|nr:MAG: hypothetical protein DI498_04975 [Paracoccus denitrificans]PZO85275.1 MAG: hypothetical protein DI633_04975 [Paracoccus denitrificans]
MNNTIPSLTRVAAVVALFSLSACVAAPVATMPAPRPGVEPELVLPRADRAERPARSARGEPIVISNNKGGNVLQMVAHRSELEASGRPVRIEGKCNSACTILTTLPNACLAPTATIGFHAPRLPNTQIIPPIVDEIMAQYYRNGVKDRWQSTWRTSLKIQSISAQEYVRLDPETRLCRS